MSWQCCHLVDTGVLLHAAQTESEDRVLAEAHSVKAALSSCCAKLHLTDCLFSTSVW